MFAQYLTVSAVSLVGLLSFRAAADGDENNYFTNPPWISGPLDTFENNNVYGLGSTLEIKWETNFSTMSLVLWQTGNASYVQLIDRQPSSEHLTWDVSLVAQYNITSAGLATPNVFSFELREIIDEGGQIGDRFSSHTFNITGGQVMKSVSTATALMKRSGVDATDDELSSATPVSHSKSLSGDAKVAIGIGVGLGVTSFVLAAAVLFLSWRNSKKLAEMRAAEALQEEQIVEQKNSPLQTIQPIEGLGPPKPAQPRVLAESHQMQDLSSLQSH